MSASNLSENRHESSWEMPLPPAVSTAQLSLVKQLNLFLELEAMFMNGNLNDSVLKFELENDLNENSGSDDFCFEDLEQDSPKRAIKTVESVKQGQVIKEIGKLPVERACGINSDEFALIDDVESDVDGDDDDVNIVNNNNSEQIKMLLNLNRADTLKPLIPSYFYESDSHCGHSFLNKNEPLIGREWVFKEIEKGLETNQICLLIGSSGTGKTKISHHLFSMSSTYEKISSSSSSSTLSSSASQNSLQFDTKSKEQQVNLATSLVGAHFCFCEDNRSLEPCQFLHNLAWSLCNFDQLTKDNVNLFKKVLTDNGNRLMKIIANKDTVRLETDLVLKKCIIDPLEALNVTNPIEQEIFFLIDGLDTKIQRSELTLVKFLSRNIQLFPRWFKFVITIRNMDNLIAFRSGNTCHLISLEAKNDAKSSYRATSLSTNSVKDLNDYIAFRINKSLDIQRNILFFNTSSSTCTTPTLEAVLPIQAQNGTPEAAYSGKLDSGFQIKFVNFLSSLSQSSFLFVKLTLDLIERGCLIVKSSNFKVLPKNIDELFRLYFNLKFSSRLAYDRLAAHIFSICLAAYKPLTLDEIYDALSCAHVVNEKLTLNELLDQINNLDGFIMSFKYFDAQLDQVSMKRTGVKNDALVKTPLYTFSHAAVREWWLQSNHNTASNSSTNSIANLKKPSYDPQWGSFLLGMRLFRSVELNIRLNSLKYMHTTNIYLDLIKHIIDSIELVFRNNPEGSLDVIAYLLSLYLPNHSQKISIIAKNSSVFHTENFYTNLLVSSEFLGSGDPNVFRVLIKIGADLNANVPYFENIPLTCALARLGHIHFIEILIHDFNLQLENDQLTYKDKTGKNILCYATQYGHTHLARELLDTSQNPTRILTEQDNSGLCALTYLSMGALTLAQHLNMTSLLDYFIINLNNDDSSLIESHAKLIQQCLVLSSMNNNQNILAYLINTFIHKANVYSDLISLDTIDSLKGETVLTIACSNGHKSICEFLLESTGILITGTNLKSWTPLLCAVKSGQWEIVEYLLGKDSQIINQADKHGRDSLILAASEGHLAIMDILIEKGANLNTYDRDGLNALSWACLKGHYNAALTLLDNEIDINHVDFSGRTSLDLATFYGDVRLVQKLIERGALIEHVDNIGMRPLDRAIGCRNVPVVACFLKKGAKLGPATWAMAAGKPEIIITLLNKLVEDGNTLYRKGSYLEALHRYSYTLKKFPKDPSELAILPENVKAIIEMKFNLLLNLARCHRKLQEYQASIDLCTKAIEIKQDSYEAFYSRARAKRDLKLYNSALEDLELASQLCSTNNDVKKLMTKINDEISSLNSKQKDKQLKIK